MLLAVDSIVVGAEQLQVIDDQQSQAAAAFGTGTGEDLGESRRAFVDDLERQVGKLVFGILKAVSVERVSETVELDVCEWQAGRRAQKTVCDFDLALLQTDEHGGQALLSCGQDHAQRRGRFAHARPGTDNHERAGTHTPAELVIQVRPTRWNLPPVILLEGFTSLVEHVEHRQATTSLFTF